MRSEDLANFLERLKRNDAKLIVGSVNNLYSIITALYLTFDYKPVNTDQLIRLKLKIKKLTGFRRTVSLTSRILEIKTDFNVHQLLTEII
jgi:hypothetical protein